MKIHAIIFGGIGALVETSELQRKSFNRAFEEAGLYWNWDAETYRRLLDVTGGRNRIRHYATAIKKTPEIDDALIAELHRRKSSIFVDAMRNTPLGPRAGVVRLINKAANSDVSLAIASTTSMENIETLAAVARIDLSAFDLVLHRDDVEQAKPDPEVYLRCQDKLELNSQHAVAIEDSESGVASATRAGLKCIAIPGANTASQNYDDATVVLDSLDEDDSLDMSQHGAQFSPRLSGLDGATVQHLVAAIR